MSTEQLEQSIDAERQAESSATEAQTAAADARTTSAAAAAVANNQGQIIEAVTAASREDAAREADRSAANAKDAEDAAAAAELVGEITIAEVGRQIAALRLELEEVRSTRSAPVAVQNEGVTPINPDETEGDKQEENQSPEEGSEDSGSGKRKHGRKRR